VINDRLQHFKFNVDEHYHVMPYMRLIHMTIKERLLLLVMISIVISGLKTGWNYEKKFLDTPASCQGVYSFPGASNNPVGLRRNYGSQSSIRL